MSIIIGIDHGYYAIKTAHCSFPAGLTSYGEHEPYTRQGLLEFGGCFFVCGSGRQPIQRDKTVNDNYYLLTLAAIAKEIQQRGLPPECSVRIAAGLPLTSFGRDKPKFKDYLLRSKQPVNFRFEGVEYSITIEEVAVFPQGYAALMTETGLLQDEPSMLLMDLGGWTVDLMRIDNAIPVADTAHSLELGMIRCVDDIREQVRRETGLSLTDAQIENAVVQDNAIVCDGYISGNSCICGNAILNSDEQTRCAPMIGGNARVYGELTGNVVCQGSAIVLPGVKLYNTTADCFVLKDDTVSVVPAQRPKVTASTAPKETKHHENER